MRSRLALLTVLLPFLIAACAYFDSVEPPISPTELPQTNAKPLVIGHRGAADLAPENTLAGIELAFELGVDAVEFDVHRSSDGELVAIHDAELDRTTDGAGFVRNLTFAELQALDAGGWFASDFAGEPVPSVRQIFEAARANDVLLFIELKDPFLYTGIEDDIVNLIAEFRYEDRAHILSFNHRALRNIRDINPDLTLSALWRDQPPPDNDGFDVVNARHTILARPEEFINGFRSEGIPVMVWTVNDPARMLALIDAGIDGITTDRPDILLQLLAP